MCVLSLDTFIELEREIEGECYEKRETEGKSVESRRVLI